MTIPQDTMRKRCKRCKKLVLVPTVLPCRSSFFLNGIWLESMDENYEIHHVGVLCFECAFCLPWEKSDIPEMDVKFSLGFMGGKIGDLSLWEAMLEVKK